VRAAVFHGRRDVRVEDVPAPRAPRPGELLVDVEWAAICGTDAAEYLHGPTFVPLTEPHPGSGHRGPTILGHEFVGRVRATGGDATGFEAGERVVCGAGVSCGTCEWCRAGRTNLCAGYYTIGLHTHGGLAEQVLVPAATCVTVPAMCEPQAAVLAQPLAVALHALARAEVRPPASLAVIGVGGIGTLIVAAAAARGIEQLVAVDVDPARLEVARRLGASETVPADGESARRIVDATGGRGVDVALEASGTEPGLATAIAAVRKGGRIVLVGLHEEPRALDLLDLNLREIGIETTLAHICETDLPEAVGILAAAGLAAAVIDRVVPLEAFVEDGLVPLAEGRVGGKVVVDVAA
jgi:(R,R)-butanediol dehydrogenase/meso-butanediol dehydrogenase/diacetyl reductase